MGFLAAERFRFDRTDTEFARGDDIDVSAWTQEEFMDAWREGWLIPSQSGEIEPATFTEPVSFAVGATANFDATWDEDIPAIHVIDNDDLTLLKVTAFGQGLEIGDGWSILMGNASRLHWTPQGAEAAASFVVNPATGIFLGDGAFHAETASTLQLLRTGVISWGDGASAVDVNLYRSAADILATDDDFELITAGKGVILKSPDETRYRLTVANGGALSAVAV